MCALAKLKSLYAKEENKHAELIYYCLKLRGTESRYTDKPIFSNLVYYYEKEGKVKALQ